jgi:NAD(P)-dependent dehydrogenase (short-subunit alcohol dehydrogenase family)
MARVLITGSSDGLGLMAGELLARDGHEVTLHARNEARAGDARTALPGAAHVVVGDLAALKGMRQVAEQANKLGRYDAVIHNAGVGYREPHRIQTPDGLSHVFAINVLAPYLLTALMTRPGRLVYLSSGMHRGGNPDLADLQWVGRPWNGSQAYADSKLLDVVLAFAVARRWPGVLSNALEPGWVPTRMGGPAGRHVPGSGHPGLAGGQRRPRGHRDRPVLLPPAAAPGPPGRVQPFRAGPAARRLRRAHRRRAGPGVPRE